MCELLFQYGLAALVIVCHSITAFRLMTYQRGISNYRSLVSLLAWLLIACIGTRVLSMMLDFKASFVTLDEAVMALLLCISVCRVKGNVARLVRGDV